MIRRTILEWEALRYGSAEACIPEWAADRIAAAAAASSLGGENGARIISHGRKELRAGQVVGVIAAEGCVLEILPKIDFADETGREVAVGRIRKQLVHMLAVALDIEIASGAVTDLGYQREDLLEILIGVFSRKLAEMVRQGLPRRYVASEDDLRMLRGQLDVVRQFTTLATRVDKLSCRYDALSPDIALNQIMKAAILRLEQLSWSSKNQRRLRELAFAYADTAEVSVSALAWHDVVLDRTNARWRELVSMAKLLLGNRFQTTSKGPGKGFSLLFEMNTLFEEYIARMLKRAFAGTAYTVHAQGGNLHCLQDFTSGAGRFMTKPDILLKHNNEVELIIDTKWKRLSERIEDPKQGIGQADVYQMIAYSRTYQCRRLMLLYPAHAKLRQPEGVIGSYRINGTEDQLGIATVDVSTRQGLTDRLRTLCNTGMAGASLVAASGQ